MGSNAIFLVTWFAYIFAPTGASLITQVVALIILLLIDRRLLGAAAIDRPYFQARLVATAIGSTALVVTALA